MYYNPKRGWCSSRQLEVARLVVVEELTFQEALLRCGYHKHTARYPKQLLDKSAGFATALTFVRSLVNYRKPANTRRWMRKATKRLLERDENPKFYQSQERREKGLPALTMHRQTCRLCHGLLEGQDRWCPNCQRCKR